MNKREFMKHASVALLVCALFNEASAAADSKDDQTIYTFYYDPDYTETVTGRNLPIDLALLGENGEATAGFYASLDRNHGTPFVGQWMRVYARYMRDMSVHSTDERLLSRIRNHLSLHGFTRDKQNQVYEQAKQIWDENPDLRVNVTQENGLSHDMN